MVIEITTAITIGGYVIGFVVSIMYLRYSIQQIRRGNKIIQQQLGSLHDAINSLTNKWQVITNQLETLEQRITRLEITQAAVAQKSITSRQRTIEKSITNKEKI